MAYANLISLDGVELSDHGRKFDESLDNRMVENELASGAKRRYPKAQKRKFSFTWTYVPSASASTTDGKGGRDAIRGKAYLGTSMVLVIRNSAGGSENYTVFVESYSEKLIRRNFVENEFFWDIDLELVEV